MTSIDFAARYRLLKNVATRGARSFLAQQVSLGRMVMVHYLDSETPEQRTATLARLDALKPPAREKLVEIADVDGSPVAVTQFISSFVDFSTWLDQVSPASAIPAPVPTPKPVESVPGDFTRAFNKIDIPAAPPVIPRAVERPPAAQTPPPPPPPAPAPTKSASDFTRIFGKVDLGPSKPAAASRAEVAPAPGPDELNSPTLIIAAQKPAPKQVPPPPPAPKQVPPAPPAATAPPPAADASSGFTAIFGRVGAQLPANLPPSTPNPAPPAPAAGRVMQPAPTPDFDRSAPPPPPSASAPPHQAGEFTQLFQRISPTAVPPSSTPPSMPVPSFGLPQAPEGRRPIEPAPLADLAPPRLTPPATSPSELRPLALGGAVSPAAFSLGSMLPAPSLGMPPAPALPSIPRPDAPPNGGMTPPNVPPAPALPWAAPPTAPGPGNMFATATGQSEFTRILGRVAVPPPPPIAIQPPAAASASAAAGQKAKSMLPLIVGLSVVILLSIAIVAYFLRRG